jgi:hypothetical protein
LEALSSAAGRGAPSFCGQPLSRAAALRDRSQSSQDETSPAPGRSASKRSAGAMQLGDRGCYAGAAAMPIRAAMPAMQQSPHSDTARFRERRAEGQRRAAVCSCGAIGWALAVRREVRMRQSAVHRIRSKEPSMASNANTQSKLQPSGRDSYGARLSAFPPVVPIA